VLLAHMAVLICAINLCAPAAAAAPQTMTAFASDREITTILERWLRRGRLFTVRIGGRELRPVAALDAFGRDIDPEHAWYDELLISGNTIVVIGYSYERGGSEVGLFNIAADGSLAYRATYHLRSNDYYSSRNYASRLIGDRLIMYTPLELNPYARDVFAQFPAVRRWGGAATKAADFRRIAPATRIYRTDADLDVRSRIALHTVTICQLSKPELDCSSTAVMGPPGHVFYVSPSSVYVWATEWRSKPRTAEEQRLDSSLFRIPLNGAAPSALKVAGSPIDQFSFLEAAGYLNVLVGADSGGQSMWRAEADPGALALMRVPLGSFSNGRDSVPQRSYRALPGPPGHSVQSRYVGGYLLYGSGAGWHQPEVRAAKSRIHAVRYARRGRVHALALDHGVDRIEALGRGAVVVGSDGNDLHFTSLRLGRAPSIANKYARAAAAQGETRSHGFFYKPDSKRSGVLGLPIIGGTESAIRQLEHGLASVLYLRNRALQFSELGTLHAQAGSEGDDGCRASCVDWYGNARPLFVGSRVFALLGYEVVEGSLDSGRITEVRRINFAGVGRN
jgi:hypothetical protein